MVPIPKTLLPVAIVLTASLLAAQSKELERGPYRLQVTLERHAEGAWAAVDPGLVFESGDRVRFRVESNFDGYLYVSNQGTSGEYRSLFPTEEAGQNNRIEAGKPYVVPEGEGAFRIAGPAGHEIVYWTLTPARVGEPDPLPPGVPEEPAAPARLQPRCDETILRARGDCIDHSAGIRKTGDTVRSRGLVFLKSDDASIIAASPKLEGPVTFEFRLAHR